MPQLLLSTRPERRVAGQDPRGWRPSAGRTLPATGHAATFAAASSARVAGGESKALFSLRVERRSWPRTQRYSPLVRFPTPVRCRPIAGAWCENGAGSGSALAPEWSEWDREMESAVAWLQLI